MGGAGRLEESKVLGARVLVWWFFLWVPVGGGEWWRWLEGLRVMRLQEMRDTGVPHFTPFPQSVLVCFAFLNKCVNPESSRSINLVQVITVSDDG